MDTPAKITLIRDIFIIVNSGIFLIILLGAGYVLFRVYRQLYPSLLRTTRNLEESSNIVVNILSQPVNLITTLLEVTNRVWGTVEQFIKRERRNEDDE